MITHCTSVHDTNDRQMARRTNKSPQTHYTEQSTKDISCIQLAIRNTCILENRDKICDVRSTTRRLLTGLLLLVVRSSNFIAAIVNTSMVDSQPSPEQYQHRHNKTTTTDWCMLYWYHWNLYTCRLDATCLSRFARTWGEMLLSFAPFSSYKK